MTAKESYFISTIFVALLFLLRNVFADEPCVDVLDIVHIQDVTSAFHPFLPSLTNKVGTFLREIENDPDIYFGLATFGDKNISGTHQKTKKRHILGSKTDYCLRVDEPLQRPDATKTVKLFKQYQSRAPGGQADSPHGVFEAIYRALIASKLQWRKPLGSEMVLRFLVVITGAISHLQGDVLESTGKKVRPFDIIPSDIRRDGDNENYDCDKVDYPTLQQLAKLIEDSDIAVLLLVAPGGTYDSKGRFKPYKSLATLGEDYQTPDGLMRWYENQLSDLGLKLRVKFLDPEMLIYDDTFWRVLQDFNLNRCRHPIKRFQLKNFN